MTTTIERLHDCPAWCTSHAAMDDDHVEHRSAPVPWSNKPDHVAQLLRLDNEAASIYVTDGEAQVDLDATDDIVRLALALLELGDLGKDRAVVAPVTGDEHYTAPGGLSWTIHPRSER
ncbi:MAG: hypothetical protein H0V07_02245 [Propionibacteriales bacterium]|nr:hypothetical protein [Propionibacteriales bacterium]